MTVSTCCSYARYGVGDKCPRCTYFWRELDALNKRVGTNTAATPEPHPFGNRATRRKFQAQRRRDMRRNERSTR